MKQTRENHARTPPHPDRCKVTTGQGAKGGKNYFNVVMEGPKAGGSGTITSHEET